MHSPRFVLLPHKPDHIKVRLCISTWNPRHVKSSYLAKVWGVNSPYMEEVYVLVPAASAYARLSYYRHIFHALILAGHLESPDKLIHFDLCEQDVTTLAYCMEETC